MIKSIRTIMKQDKERYKVPRKVQDVIPIRRIWPDGIFQVGNKFTKMYRFTDINYLVASREDKESMFLTYSELLNSLDSGATTKLTIYNHRQNRASFEKSILMPMKEDGLDQYRKEYNQMLLDKATGLTDLNRNMMLSIDILPIPTDEAVHEVESRLLGVETNITNWQRRQNANNNFSAVVPYDMELQRKGTWY